MTPLFTDLYQLTMAQAYLASNKHNDKAVFELFFRKCPFGGEYAIAAGYDIVQEILENFKFSQEDINYLKALPIFKDSEDSFFKALQNLDLNDVEVLGIPEGDLVFPRTPLLQVRGPIFKTQLLESALLNAVNFSTLVTTYARRLRLVSGNRKIVEFGMRRAQGPNGAMTATRGSFLGGFDSTSNVLAGKQLGIPVTGTVAHSFVQSFREIAKQDLTWNGKSIESELNKVRKQDGLVTNEGELGSFLAFARVFPSNTLLLVDTYDTLKSGVPNALRVFKILRSQGHKPLGVRLDSGDLVYLSRETRKMLDQEGFADAKIFVSNELDEDVIETIQDQGALIDSYGIGTNLVTASKQPALGGVYKLVEVNGYPRLKISQQTDKLIIPSAKKLYRFYGKDGKMLMDLMTLDSEPAPKAGEKIHAIHPLEPYKHAEVTPHRVEPLLQALFQKGKWLDHVSLHEKRERSLKKMEHLRSDIVRRHNPTPYKVAVSRKHKDLMDQLYNKEVPPSQIH